MIPLKLSLRNFMCYRENVPLLSLEGIHVALLCGDNGNGKSALFDAMTWALWGKSRADSDDDLIYQGANETEVELEFSSQGQRYRVIRKYIKGSASRSGQSDLQLQIASGDKFNSLSGETISETKKKIVLILGLEYETFVNSAFLMQGRADSFSIKDPAKRKEIISGILGLSSYDRLEERAREMRKGAEYQAQILRHEIGSIDKQVLGRNKDELELEKWLENLVKLEETQMQWKTDLEALQKRMEGLELKKQDLEHLTRDIEARRASLAGWDERIKKHHQRIDEYRGIQAGRLELEEGYRNFVKLKEASEEFGAKLSRVLNMKDKIREVERAINEEETCLLEDRARIQDRVSTQEEKVSRLSGLEADLTVTERRAVELESFRTRVVSKQRQLQEVITEFQRLEQENLVLEQALKALVQKLDLLAKGGATCPLCGTSLGDEGREHIETEWQREMAAKKEAQSNNLELLKRVRLKRSELEREISEGEAVLNRELAKNLAKLDTVRKEIQEITTIKGELTRNKIRLGEICSVLQVKSFAREAHEGLQQLRRHLDSLGYDGGKHEAISKQLAEVKSFEELKRKLDEADRIIGESEAALMIDEKEAGDLRLVIEGLVLSRSTAQKELSVLPQVEAGLMEVKGLYEQGLKEEKNIRDEVVKLQARLHYYETLQKDREEKERIWRQNTDDASAYKELVEAFGKKGVQALLIERSLPEVELEANRLLGRMTDNRMSLRLETQISTKKGGTVETLNVRISDELGMRNYEMYSGGEAFRINLALRIALSKLLVKRAGASMPVLILDEGFGTQDSSGREKLVEAINSIQDDFDKILVVTHLEELKDYFPDRINVVKTANGSMLLVE